MRAIFYFVLISVLTFSCSDKQVYVMKTGIEKNAGWMNLQTLSGEKAHSGLSSSKLDSINIYGIGYQEYFGTYKDLQFKFIDVDFWVYFPVQCKESAVLVFSIDSPEKPGIFWQGLPFHELSSQTNQWINVKQTIEVPADKNKLANNFLLYCWSPKGDPFYIDDMAISFRE